MSDYEFWRSTPKQLIIKSRIYSRFKNNENEELENVIVEFYKSLQEEIYIDDVF